MDGCAVWIPVQDSKTNALHETRNIHPVADDVGEGGGARAGGQERSRQVTSEGGLLRIVRYLAAFRFNKLSLHYEPYQ